MGRQEIGLVMDVLSLRLCSLVLVITETFSTLSRLAAVKLDKPYF